MTNPTDQRIKLHVYSSQVPVLLLRVARFLASQGIAIEAGNHFVKFARGNEPGDQAAAALKAMGFKVLPSMDIFQADDNHNMGQKSAAALEAENTPKGHVHGPGCGHDHHDHHDHGHEHHGHSHEDHHHDQHDHHDHKDHDHGHKH
jgi:hypothetical protein